MEGRRCFVCVLKVGRWILHGDCLNPLSLNKDFKEKELNSWAGLTAAMAQKKYHGDEELFGKRLLTCSSRLKRNQDGFSGSSV